ncbi:MAG: hypothetical protein WCE23_10165 [Candidatus Binatus sp.]|uniref:hypothetical protein n=1 Tax=Candidatus Binatus sp. TaxID=2811406 RepID=UPI003C7234AB
MTKEQALGELRQIREQLDQSGESIGKSLELAENALKDAESGDTTLANLTMGLAGTIGDRVTLYRALDRTMSAVSAMAEHLEYLFGSESD